MTSRGKGYSAVDERQVLGVDDAHARADEALNAAGDVERPQDLYERRGYKFTPTCQ